MSRLHYLGQNFGRESIKMLFWIDWNPILGIIGTSYWRDLWVHCLILTFQAFWDKSPAHTRYTKLKSTPIRPSNLKLGGLEDRARIEKMIFWGYFEGPNFYEIFDLEQKCFEFMITTSIWTKYINMKKKCGHHFHIPLILPHFLRQMVGLRISGDETSFSKFVVVSVKWPLAKADEPVPIS